MLFQKRHRPAPRQISGFLIVTRGIGVVVEGVVGTFVHVKFVGLAVGFQAVSYSAMPALTRSSSEA